MTKSDAIAAMEALTGDQQAFIDVQDQVFAPLAGLCVGKGIRIRTVEERIRGAFVKAAHDAQPEQSRSRLTSRLSAATGLTRREVARLERLAERSALPQRSPMTDLFTR